MIKTALEIFQIILIFKSSKQSKLTDPIDSNMYHFAFANQLSMSYLILVILIRQSTANDKTHDTNPAKMILTTANSMNSTNNITTKSVNIDRQ